MSLEPHRATSADEEIDLAELIQSLGRQRRWWLSAMAMGLLLGGAFGMAQIRTREVALIIALDQGPQRDSSQAPGLDDGVSKRFTSLGIVMQPPTPIIPLGLLQRQLEQQVALESATTAPNWRWQVAQSKNGRDLIPNTVEVSVNVPEINVPAATQRMRAMERAFRKDQFAAATAERLPLRAAPGWTQVLVGPQRTGTRGRSLALGGLAGLVFGAGLALMADRRADRVWSLRELQQRLPYPLLCMLPPKPWNFETCGAYLGQLTVMLDRALSWTVVSIGQDHPGTANLVQTLQELWPEVELATGPVLLREPLRPPSDNRPLGVLVLLEPGFNSARALDAAHRLLAQLPFVGQVGLIAAGQPVPRELQADSSHKTRPRWGG